MPGLDRGASLSGTKGAHLESCLRCQAEAARYRGLGRELKQIAALVDQAPSGMVDAVMERIGVPLVVVGEERHKVTTVAAAGALVAAASTIAVLTWRRRSAA